MAALIRGDRVVWDCPQTWRKDTGGVWVVHRVWNTNCEGYRANLGRPGDDKPTMTAPVDELRRAA